MTKRELKQHKSEILKLFRKNLRAGTQSLCSDFEDALDLTNKELQLVLSKLFKDKKLESFGNEITSYKKGFRFPEEIRFILRKLLRCNTPGDAYRDANEIVNIIEKSVDKAKILRAGEINSLWGKNFPFIDPDTSKYLHRHFGYLAKLGGKLQPKMRLKKNGAKVVSQRKRKEVSKQCVKRKSLLM